MESFLRGDLWNTVNKHVLISDTVPANANYTCSACRYNSTYSWHWFIQDSTIGTVLTRTTMSSVCSMIIYYGIGDFFFGVHLNLTWKH